MSTPTSDDVKNAIAQAAVDGIESTLIDGVSVREQSLDSRIRALKELKNDEATNATRLPIRKGRFISCGLQ